MLHPQMQAVLDAMSQGPPIEHLSIDEARAQTEAASRVQFDVRADVAASVNTVLRPGGPPCRVYRPDSRSTAQGAVIYFHGGGFVVGSLETDDGICREICARSGVVLVSVAYRLAPEAPFPAAVEDAVTALRSIAADADAFGVDRRRLAVVGTSAGGTIAAAAASVCARDVPLAAQVLVYPVLDAEMTMSSTSAYRSGSTLTSAGLAWLLDHYLEPQADRSTATASPINAPELDRLPATLLISCRYDPLNEEQHDYVRRLRAAGVAVTHEHFDDMAHGFMEMPSRVDRAQEALAVVCDFVKAHVGQEVLA